MDGRTDPLIDMRGRILKENKNFTQKFASQKVYSMWAPGLPCMPVIATVLALIFFSFKLSPRAS